MVRLCGGGCGADGFHIQQKMQFSGTVTCESFCFFQAGVARRWGHAGLLAGSPDDSKARALLLRAERLSHREHGLVWL